MSVLESLSWRAVDVLLRTRFPGIPEVSTDEVHSAAARGEPPVLIDVRNDEEFAVSHIPGARQIHPDAADTPDWIKEAGRDQWIVAYCSVGYRSAALVDRLRREGYDRSFNMAGSIFKWANEGKKLESAGEGPRGVHPFDRTWGRLLRRDLWKWTPEGD